MKICMNECDCVYFWKVNDNFVIDLKFSGKYGMLSISVKSEPNFLKHIFLA